MYCSLCNVFNLLFIVKGNWKKETVSCCIEINVTNILTIFCYYYHPLITINVYRISISITKCRSSIAYLFQNIEFLFGCVYIYDRVSFRRKLFPEDYRKKISNIMIIICLNRLISCLIWCLNRISLICHAHR